MPNKNTFGRIPLSIVQIDQDLCCKEWKATNGCGTCNTVATESCYNTFNTCQSVSDYTLGNPLTLSFAKSHSDLPLDDLYIIPSVKSISTSPGRINVGGRAGRDKPLGKRTELTVTFSDHQHSDNFTDPYLSSRTHNPLESGTFWGKWLKRNPYYKGRSVRLYEGYHGQTLEEMRVRHYVIDSITLPDSSGSVTLKALDALVLADDKKAKAPTLSNGKLLNDILSTDTSIIVTGATLAEYTALPTKIINIGDELIRYTTVAEDVNLDLVFSGLTRGSDNTTAEDHEASDTVQACLEYVSERPDSVAYDLITTYGNMPASQVDLTGWTDEADVWLASYTVSRIVSKPTGVTELLGELCEQSMMYIWFDDYANLVKMRVIHPPFNEVPLITEEGHLLQNSVTIKNQNSLLSTEVWVSFLPLNPLKHKDQGDFKRTLAVIDPVSSSSFAFDERRVYNIKAAWLDNDAIVTQLANRLLSRYAAPPIFIKFGLDAKDNDLGLGDIFDISFSGFVDETGQKEIVRYQVISCHEVEGSVVKYEAQKFDYLASTRIGYYMEDAAPDYSTASDTEKANGGFYSDDAGLVDGDTGYEYV